MRRWGPTTSPPSGTWPGWVARSPIRCATARRSRPLHFSTKSWSTSRCARWQRRDWVSDTLPDLLGVSFSGSDHVGHTYGPDSHEVMDATVRLDRTLQRLFGFLDRTIGLSRVLVVLTADHGVAPMPEVLQRMHPGTTAAGRLNPAVIDTAVRRALARYGPIPAPGWVVYHAPPLIYFNASALAALNVPVEDAERVGTVGAAGGSWRARRVDRQ